MSSDSEDGLDLFQEPEGYFEPEKQPTFVSHKLLDGRELNLRLVGHNPLWVGGCIFFYLFRFIPYQISPNTLNHLVLQLRTRLELRGR